MQNIKKYTVLDNGVKMPWLGFGTYKVENKDTVIESVKEAVKVGYCHIDTASFYNNEEAVGVAIKWEAVKNFVYLIFFLEITSYLFNLDQLLI